MKTIKIFLASSEELRLERLELADLVEHLNKILEKLGMRIQLVKWEYLDSSMGPLRKQDEYNNELKDCEMCIVIYWTRFGMYTKEELDTAYNELCAGHNPKKLYVYFKDSNDLTEELKVFRDSFPTHYGHFACNFSNIDTLKADFLLQFIDYEGKQLGKSIIELQNSHLFIGGKDIASLQNIPFAGNNEEYQELKEDIEDLKDWLDDHEPDHPKYNDKIAKYNKKKERLSKIESSLWDTALMITHLSTTKCSGRLERAIKLFNQGDNKGANAVLNEVEIDHDVQHNLNLIKLGEEGKRGLKINIEEYQLKIQTLRNEMNEGWGEKVMEFYQKVISLTRKLYGEKSKEVAKVQLEATNVCELITNFSQELSYSKSALEILISLYGENHKETVLAYDRVGWAYRHLDKPQEALSYGVKAYEICSSTYGKMNTLTAETCNNVGIEYDTLGLLDDALKYLNQALTIRQDIFGKHHKDTAESYNNIGYVYNEQGRYELALQFHNTALQIYKKNPW